MIQVVKKYSFEKTGLNEVVGLKECLVSLMQPIHELLSDRAYWTDLGLEEAEYKSRDGFIPHSHNCGGVQLHLVVPKCEEGSFSFLAFGECDDEECDHEIECSSESEGHLDAALRIWFKFEGIDEETNELKFWLYVGGGNGDAPYFRSKHEATIFEKSFSVKSLEELNVVGAAAVQEMLKVIS